MRLIVSHVMNIGQRKILRGEAQVVVHSEQVSNFGLATCAVLRLF